VITSAISLDMQNWARIGSQSKNGWTDFNAQWLIWCGL